MARNQDYKVLLLTSLPGIMDDITVMTRADFANVESLYWQMGNKETKSGVLGQIEASGYNLIISMSAALFCSRAISPRPRSARSIFIPPRPSIPAPGAFTASP